MPAFSGVQEQYYLFPDSWYNVTKETAAAFHAKDIKTHAKS
jgi:hypothetical protein